MLRRAPLALTLVFLGVSLAPVAFADFIGRVVEVTDGDTIKVMLNG